MPSVVGGARKVVEQAAVPDRRIGEASTGKEKGAARRLAGKR